MELVEIVVQGLQGAPELLRVPFQPGVTVFSAGPRERLYSRLILDLLYPRGSEPTLLDLDTPGSQSRVALTVQGRDGHVYRLLHDVHTGRRALQRVVGDRAEPLTNVTGEIAQAVTATLGFPQEDILRELLFCVKEDLPSQRRAPAAGRESKGRAATPAAKSADKPLPPGFEGPSTPPRREDKPLPPGFSAEGAPVVDRGGRDDAQIRARLAEIDAALSSQEGVKDLEFELDGLQKKIFEIEGRLRPLLTLRRSVQQAEERLGQFAAIEHVPADLVEKGERLQKLRAEHERELLRLDEEKQKLIHSAGTLDASGRQRPLEVAQRDPLVRYGLAAGVGAVALGLAGALAAPALQWAALLDIPAFGVALAGGIRVLGSLEEGESIRRRILRLDEQRRKLSDRFKIDEEQVRSVLEKHGYAVEQLPELAEQLTARAETRAVLDKTRQALEEAQREGDTRTLEAEQADVQSRIRALEEQLANASVGYGGAGDLLAEKEELEAVLRGGAAAAAPIGAAALFGESTSGDPSFGDPTFGDPGLGDPNDDAPASGHDHVAERAAPVEDLARRLVELARDILMSSVEDVSAAVQPRAGQILAALADGRYREVRFGGRGETSVVDAAAGEVIAFGLLPPFDRDLVWLAVKVALIETVVKRGRVPVLFDRGLDGLADAKGAILQKMLQFLAASTQVVSISEKPALGGRAG